ncbi:MAG: hypothetical protein RIB84_23745 [Sneathiellaceae bacterium]
MTDDLIVATVPGWILARDRFDGPASWRRDPLTPPPRRAVPPPPPSNLVEFRRDPARCDEIRHPASFWPYRPRTTQQDQRP